MNKKGAPLAKAFGGSAKRSEGDADPNAQTHDTVNPASEAVNNVNREKGDQAIDDVKPLNSETVNMGIKGEGAKSQIVLEEVETVPGPRGQRLPADAPVNLTFTVTAKERYLWNLELTRRGATAVSVLRRAMQAFVDES